MTLQIWSGSARVLDTGVVITFLGAPLWFELVIDDRKFVIQVVFKTDDATSEPSVQSELLPEFLNIALVNFHTAEGRGTWWPVLIGEQGEDLIFLHFQVRAHGRSDDREFTYTFYRAPRAGLPFAPVLVYGNKGG